MEFPEPRPPEYGIVVAENVMVPMRDGVHLATDIYRPALGGEIVEGQFPVILGRTSYDKTTPWMWVDPVARFFTPRGYVVVLQDLRGRYKSEGFGEYYHVANPSDGKDGFDTIGWIASQPWSNGRVGMLGSSHGAMSQTTAALENPPALAAIWPDVGPTNAYHHHIRLGGAMQLHMFGAQFLHAFESQELMRDPVAKRAFEQEMTRLRDWVWLTPFRPGMTPLTTVPGLEQTFFNYYLRGSYDEWWAEDFNDFERHFHRHADCPGTFSGGWYDPFAVATTTHFAAMSAQSRSPQRLIMGPWTHETMRRGDSWAADVDFGEDAIVGNDRYNALRLQWFDRWLRDERNGVDDDPPVRMFVMGGGGGRKTRHGKLFHGGRWRTEQGWPLARAAEQVLFLRAAGELTSERPSAIESSRSFVYDPTHPVPTISGNVVGFFELVPVAETVEDGYQSNVPWRVRMRSIVKMGPTHQREAPDIIGARPPYPRLAHRNDVLVFQSPPLMEPVEVTGQAVVNLWVSSSAVDTDFTAKLVDVYPPMADYPEGYHMNIVDSIIRVRFRESWEREVFMEPGEVVQVQIALPPTSNLFDVGHRIRIDISSSNFPRFDLNPNTGEPSGRHTHMIPSTNTVYMDREHPSHVVLPVII
ncbi:MAG: CocE/NonD family hydrolase [Thermomicrobiales bacterium]|nr:CocE/NonD family hydrolase [Thermomicrobiales bacterium]